METHEIIARIQDVIREVLDDESINLTAESSAADVEGWTSLTQVAIVAELENAFNIHFKLSEMMSWNNIGDMAECIAAKI